MACQGHLWCEEEGMNMFYSHLQIFLFPVCITRLFEKSVAVMGHLAFEEKDLRESWLCFNPQIAE